MNHDNDYHDDINYGNRFPDDWYFQEDKSSNYMKEEISSGIRELWRKLNSPKDRKVFHTLSNDLDECLTLVTHLWVLDNESRSTLEELLQQEVRKRIENDINSQLNSLAN